MTLDLLEVLAIDGHSIDYFLIDQKPSKYCRICGDIACGFHFDALSCESCKSFFRRNALKDMDDIKCFLGRNCEITVGNRKRCKRCRLDKCLAAGMKTHLIYSRKHKKDINVNISEQQLVSINRPLTDYSTVFNELEANRFTELLNGTKKFQNLVDITNRIFIDEMSDGLNVLNIKHENGIRDIVQMSGLLASFGDLCENDRLILIKYSSIEINILRMVSSFNFQEGYWDIVLGDSSYMVRLDLLNHHKVPGEIESSYDCHKNFLQCIGHDWESDPLILDFLTAILLFNPNRPHLIYPSAIKYQQNIYIYLFTRYLRMKYRSELLSSAKYMRLEIEHSKHHHLPDPLHTAPLFTEICTRVE
ncbi:unnamed protein product [Medioppia subpectinata]|uniref:Nuclear receptor domain-containing protein n=1 Tax=Medioppia subpectinata TaxID=1979941 RepID=A0A7R9KBC0_9ACAR|nr:unnamed protein product [Medioppia subpectinata]CAG2099957.1 unnamed protein product [Medioppia subpectinata]